MLLLISAVPLWMASYTTVFWQFLDQFALRLRPYQHRPAPGNERTKAAWGQVLHQQQLRVDLIPNLLETVYGYAGQERGTPRRDQ